MKRCPICARSYDTAQRFCSVHGLPLVEEIDVTSREPGELSGLVLDSRYRLGGVAGRGGMGIVYEAENLRIGRRCAVKVLHRELHADAKMRMRLFREVQATSRVRHPNVVEILDFGDDEKVGSYLVMEFLDGQSLAEVIRAGAPLPLPFILKVGVQLSAGLTATHSHGLIHRDLKPSNVRLLSNGQIKVLDFGLVKPYEPGTAKEFVTITTGGIAFGTPWYMSPEQATFQSLDPRTDIYSMGVILYEMATGRTPFVGNNPLELIDAHRSLPVPLPSKLEPPVPIAAPLEMLILKALSKEPDLRHQSMSELMDALLGVADQHGISTGELQLQVCAPTPGQPATGPLQQVTVEVEVDPEWTLLVASTITFPDLRPALLGRLDEIVPALVKSLRAIIPRYRAIDPDELGRNVKSSLESSLIVFAPEGAVELPEGIRRVADVRSGQQFTPTDIIGALWIELTGLRPLIRDELGEAAQHPGFEEQLEQRILSFVLKLVEYYFARYNARLISLNEALSKQNSELLELRGKLTDQVQQVSRQIVEAEQLKARIVEYISSVLILFDNEDRKVQIFNRAAERMSGLSASSAVGRTIDEVMTFVEGVPLEEFREQLHLHEEVGLRKLWLRLRDGSERAVYVRGQTFSDQKSGRRQTLFIVDDVTERENIIESFSRYLSREVVESVLKRGKQALLPSGQARRVTMMAVNIRDFRRLSRDMPIDGVVEILSDYVRAVGDSVFHQGGTIETMIGDSLLIYFDDLRGCAPALHAAVELIRRLETVNAEREQQSRPPILVGVGVHVGDVLVAMLGGKRRMVHALVGEAALIAQSLQEVASAGEILVSAEAMKSAGEGFSFENGPVISVEGQSAPVEAFRIVFKAEPLPTPA
jgi:PAS domain S-box-containing protein